MPVQSSQPDRPPKPTVNDTVITKMAPPHVCSGEVGCGKCSHNRNLSVLFLTKDFSLPSPIIDTGDANLDYLDKVAHQMRYMQGTFEYIARTLGAMSPALRKYNLDSAAIHEDTIRDIAMQRDYYLGLSIAVAAEEQKGAGKWDEELLAAFKKNRDVLIKDFDRDVFRPENTARMQAYAEKSTPEAAKSNLTWDWEEDSQHCKKAIDAYRKEHGF